MRGVVRVQLVGAVVRRGLVGRVVRVVDIRPLVARRTASAFASCHAGLLQWVKTACQLKQLASVEPESRQLSGGRVGGRAEREEVSGGAGPAEVDQVQLARAAMFAQQERTPPLHPRQASFPGAIAQSDSDYGVKIGLEKACPGTMHQGLSGDAVLLVSEAGHYCAANIAGWLGMGTDNLVTVPTTEENEIDLDHLGRAAREALASGKRIAAIIATLGTTDAFGLDDLQAIAALRDSLVEEFQLPCPPHIHADAVIGWAWSVFNDYDFEGNPLGFRPAPCAPWPAPAGAYATCRWPTPSASTSTRPASPPTSPASCW